MRKYKTVIYTILTIALLLSLTACGEKSVPEDTPDVKAYTVNKPKDIPEDDSVLELQTVEESGSDVYITALSGRYEASEGFIASSKQIFTFKICGDEDGFVGYFWEPAVEGASSRMQYRDANGFISLYYDVAIERGAFYPMACTYEFNRAGEITSLYECADLSYQLPEPETDPEIETEPGYDDYIIVLYAEDADLTGADDVVLEPNDPPYNLGGWRAGNTVTWEFDLDFEDIREGVYDVYIEYSRAYTDAEVWGTVNIARDIDYMSYYYEFQAENTSSGDGDWSEYETMQIGYGRFYTDVTFTLEMSPGTDEEELQDEHFINLRSIILVPTELDFKAVHEITNTTTPVAFEGRWFSYSANMWVIIEGNTYTTIYASGRPGSESKISGVCELVGESLILYGEGTNITLTFSPDGILTGPGHLRPQDGDVPDEAPIDLSANSYLGEWYCEELGESITLMWDYEVSHEAGGRYSSGDYEPYGNRLFLGRTSTGGGEDTIFNGGDAVYDPDAQTLTTAGRYVYERVSYGGGRKHLPKYVEYYDLFDWGSPYRSKEDVASDIIAVWQENDEDIDPKYFDVDYLVEAIDDSDSECEKIFAIACEVVGIDMDTYYGDLY